MWWAVRALSHGFALLVLIAVSSIAWAQGEAARELPASQSQMYLSFAPLVRSAAPAVVNITTRKEMVSRGLDPFAADPLFRFFDDFSLGRRRTKRQREQNSLGSGVIVRSDGLIVTNQHVVADASEITVVLSDRREFEARLLGSDERADLALLRIDPGEEELPALAFGDSDDLEVGDLVLAIGNPFGIGQTVTSGIVSALARTAPRLEADVSFIQTDAAINPGNSGGALVTMDGRLVGINTAMFTRGGGSIGIGFAIPASLVRTLIRSIEKGNGEVARPWIGANGQAVDADLAESLGLSRPMGVLVNDIYENGPAGRAGMLSGDIILSVDGFEVYDTRGLRFRLSVHGVGEVAELTVWRSGKMLTIGVAMEPPPLDPPAQITRLRDGHALAGLMLANLSPAFNQQIGIDSFARGVVVLEVVQRSLAYRLRLRPRDVIFAVNGQEIATIDDLDAVFESSENRLWRMRINRGGRTLDLAIGG